MQTEHPDMHPARKAIAELFGIDRHGCWCCYKMNA